MKLPLRIAIKCDEEELTEAKWNVIAQLRTALLQEATRRALRAELRDWLPGRSAQTASPGAWVRAFSAAVLAWVQERAASAQAAWEYEQLARRCEYLEQQIQTYREHPLQERVTRLQATHERGQQQAAQQAQRIADLEQQLSATRQRAQKERTRLEREIAQLNEIIVHQQEALRAQQR